MYYYDVKMPGKFFQSYIFFRIEIPLKDLIISDSVPTTASLSFQDDLGFIIQPDLNLMTLVLEVN
jgi:hypothetical protein